MSKKSIAFRLLLIVILPICMCCTAENKPGQRPKYWPLDINGYVFSKIELALSDKEITLGLMDRDELADDGGMLFVFNSEASRFFWMKNVRFPLDIAFLDGTGTVVSMHRMAQERPKGETESEEAYYVRLPSYDSGKPAQFALELKSGQLDFLDLQVGTKIDIGKTELMKLKAQFGE